MTDYRGVPAGLPFKFDAATIKRGLNFTLDTDFGPLDLLGEATGGGTFDALLPHTIALDRKRNKVYAFLPQSHRAAVLHETG